MKLGSHLHFNWVFDLLSLSVFDVSRPTCELYKAHQDLFRQSSETIHPLLGHASQYQTPCKMGRDATSN